MTLTGRTPPRLIIRPPSCIIDRLRDVHQLHRSAFLRCPQWTPKRSTEFPFGILRSWFINRSITVCNCFLVPRALRGPQAPSVIEVLGVYNAATDLMARNPAQNNNGNSESSAVVETSEEEPATVSTLSGEQALQHLKPGLGKKEAVAWGAAAGEGVLARGEVMSIWSICFCPCRRRVSTGESSPYFFS